MLDASSKTTPKLQTEFSIQIWNYYINFTANSMFCQRQLWVANGSANYELKSKFQAKSFLLYTEYAYTKHKSIC